MSISENVHAAGFKTRVLILSSSSRYSAFIQQIFHFHNIKADWYGAPNSDDSDFIILQTSDLSEATAFRPNIALLSGELAFTSWQTLLNHITPGGVLIYPQSLEEFSENNGVYFRKLPHNFICV